ncbi:hypothetical protein VTO58DRAFT_103572 [Aureobasidium pullulans]
MRMRRQGGQISFQSPSFESFFRLSTHAGRVGGVPLIGAPSQYSKGWSPHNSCTLHTLSPGLGDDIPTPERHSST